MKIIDEIKAIANCDMETARTIRNNINNDWALDWSECSQSQFVRVVKKYAEAISCNQN